MRWPLINFSQPSRRWRIAYAATATGVAAILALALLAGLHVRTKYAHEIFESDKAPVATYGVVLGASVDQKTGAPSQPLTDRLDTALELLKRQSIMGVIISGDDGRWRSDERAAMLAYLHKRDVPDDVIFIDDGAYRTFDSCKNLANHGFRSVALITQQFHLPRALYLCNEIGVHAIGVSADRRWYPKLFYHWARDLVASPFAFLDVRGVTLIEKGPPV